MLMSGDGIAAAPTELVHVLWAPDTPLELIEAAESSFAAVGDPHDGLFEESERWSRTATDGSGLRQGDPTTLTWSIVPDGTSISGFNGEPSAPSDLRARFDEIYGSIDVWLPVVTQVFDRWSELSGVTYVYQEADDGVSLNSWNSGVLGTRSDVRIGGHFIDGNSGVLAYNFYPNGGDMVIDTADSFFNNTNSNSRRLRNTLAHEAGHGLGLQHVIPTNRTKLMEPYLTTAFDGPQFNDILAVHRGYGDPFEGNDTIGSAVHFGDVTDDAFRVDNVSIDDDADVDFFSFTLTSASSIDVVLTPVGPTYSLGNHGGSSSSFNASTQSDLTLTVFDADGSIVLASVDAGGVGDNEIIADLPLESPGTYFIRITGNADHAQMYELDVSASVVATNTNPIASADAYFLLEGDSLSVSSVEGVLANDIDTDGDPLAVSLAIGPQFAQAFQLNADGSFVYEATAGFVGTDGFTYHATDGQGGSTVGTVTLTVDPQPAPPAVDEFMVNSGVAQRSSVTELVFEFDQNVAITTDALVVLKLDTNEILSSRSIKLVYDSDTFTATFTFVGLAGASLPDGNYEVTLLSSQVTGITAPLVSSEPVYVLHLHRLYGDVDGDRRVDISDLFSFRNAMNSNPGDAAYMSYLDFDADGEIGLLDLFQFRSRFDTELPEPVVTSPLTQANPSPSDSIAHSNVSTIASLLASFRLETVGNKGIIGSVGDDETENHIWDQEDPLGNLWEVKVGDG